MNEYMIDIETLSTHKTAAIVTIAVVQFEIETGKVGKELLLEIGEENSTGHISRDCINEFWMKQPLEVREQLTPSNPLTMVDALCDLGKFLVGITPNEKERIIWGNGPGFDMSILENQYESFGVSVPWRHWNVNCVRTICRFGDVKKYKIPFTGTPHDPIDDCLHQIKMVHRAYKNLKG